ncbi:MAG: hypothetical protein O3A36_02305 [bacterium]|nr:hypothetical protein [bacterium]
MKSQGIQHGDTAEVEIEGAGAWRDAMGNTTIAFCPINIVQSRVLQEGTLEERQLPIPLEISISGKLRKRILRNAPENGFVRLSLSVHSNGVLELRGRVIHSESAPRNAVVNHAHSYDEYKAASQLLPAY